MAGCQVRQAPGPFIRIDSGVPPTPPIVTIATGVGLLAAAGAIAPAPLTHE